MEARDRISPRSATSLGTVRHERRYGRTFLTKEDFSFYAYDLSEGKGLKRVSTLQVRGRNPDRSQALNLGIFYEDNPAKKHGFLKLDDPYMIEQIDALFLTVEPNRGVRNQAASLSCLLN